MAIRECAKCGEEYDPKNKRNGGLIIHCDNCSEETVEKYLGRQGCTNKDASITVLKTNLSFWRAQIKRENAIGFNANLPVGNPVSQMQFDARKEE